MSRYNHSDLIKRDPSGELHFVVWKVLKIIYAYVTTLLVRLDLKTGGVKYGAGLKARGCCIVERFPCSTIEIGNYCAFTSSVGLILEELIINVLYRQDALELK